MQAGRILLSAVVVGAVTLAAGPLLAKCASPDEAEALRARVIQSDLMVAALSCGEHESYNRFVLKFGDELASRGKRLKAYFKRTFGARGERELNRFITRLANDSSSASIKDIEAFCTSSRGQFAQLTELDAAAFDDFVAQQPRALANGHDTCD